MAVAGKQLTASATEEVASAVTDVRETFKDKAVHAWPDGSGGAYVVIEELDFGPIWEPRTSWLGFVISYLHPDADCYPHYIRADAGRADKSALSPPFNVGNAFAGVSAVMISRSTRRLRKDGDTPAIKAVKVLEFIRQPG
jgi:hypothetical protein